MMLYPPVTELMKHTGSRYSLVIAVAKRARELAQEEAEPLVICNSNKEVTKAVYELYYDKIRLVDGKEKKEPQFAARAEAPAEAEPSEQAGEAAEADEAAEE